MKSHATCKAELALATGGVDDTVGATTGALVRSVATGAEDATTGAVVRLRRLGALETSRADGLVLAIGTLEKEAPPPLNRGRGWRRH